MLFEDIFPELVESEDERIRNEIIAFVVQSIHRGGGTPIPEEQETKWIAWLEKQGEKPILSNSLTSEQRVEEAMRELEEKSVAYMEAHKGETADEFIALCRGEQKPAWSEDDYYNLQCCIDKVQSDIDNGTVGRNRELLNWLNSLKDRLK